MARQLATEVDQAALEKAQEGAFAVGGEAAIAAAKADAINNPPDPAAVNVVARKLGAPR